MADMRDLHQIEYRHHQTMDLSPVASSMRSREPLAAWDSRIRAWVRHPDADTLSESACYQVFPNGQAALAWRYWDERAASREDGTLGRPLVSRVLVGSVSVLTPEVAVASCRAGISAEWIGPLPGQVPDGSDLPMVSGEALIALTREMTSALDQASARQAGLQAVVAAALAEPAVPLAISIDDVLIQVPLRECVQCPLLWGLHRITGPLFGPVGRGWSFSTFELSLGKTDPTSLPGIVFREAQEGMKAPPSRWRREARVRPFEDGALDDETSYAGMIEQAGWLVAEYREQGGEGLERFITARAGGAGSFSTRVEQISEALRKGRQPASTPGHWRLAGRLGARPPVLVPEQQDARPAEALSSASLPADPAEMSRRTAPGSLDSQPADAGFREPESWHAADPQITATQQHSSIQDGGSERRDSPFEAPQPGDWFPGAPRPEASQAGETQVQRPEADGTWSAAGEYRGGSGYPEPTRLTTAGLSAAEGAGRDRRSWGGHQGSLSFLLRQLELLGEDQPQFESILDSIYQLNDPSLEERSRSWEVISSNDWYLNICGNNAFRSGDLANIFGIVVIAAPAEHPAAAVIAKWALEAPPPMVTGLLAAARTAGTEMWSYVMDILEPTLAYRWTIDKFIPDYWDEGRVARSYAAFGHDDGNRGFLGWRRRSARRS